MSLPVPLHVALGALAPLLGGPLLLGLVRRVKSRLAGRRGPPLLQPWYELLKLARKGVVRSEVSGCAFHLAPALVPVSVAVAAVLLPWGGCASPLGFQGDLLFLAGALALSRVALVLAALDTGSSFEGLGASREHCYAVLAEPALLVALAAAHGSSLSDLTRSCAVPGATEVLAALALFIVLLAENARVPFDDPATHLELTMVHEVLVLDASGPDLALLEWGAGAKLFVFAQLLVAPLAARMGGGALAVGAHLGLVAAVGALVALVESSTARLRLPRAAHLLLAALLVAAFAAGVALLRRGA